MRMFMTERVFENLEMKYIFSRIEVYTPYGEVFKKKMCPYLTKDRAELETELKRIGIVLDCIEKHRYTFVEMRNIFKTVKDLRGSFQRIKENQTLSTVELFEIKSFVNILSNLDNLLNTLKWELADKLKVITIPAIRELLDPQNNGINTFYIYDEYSVQLRETRENIRNIEAELNRRRADIREKIQQELKLSLRPNGEITINKTNRELLEIIQSYRELVYSAETYMNITYKIRTTEYEDEMIKFIEDLREVEEEEERKVRRFLTCEIKKHIEILDFNADAIGGLDLLIAKAYMAIGMKGVCPRITSHAMLNIAEGRHIKIEDNLRKQGKNFTAITVSLKMGVTCITGANMGGKTICLKLIGLLTAMAQYGLFVPAESMEFSLNDYIFLSMGDQQSADMGLSTFGAEIAGIREILERADERGLILVDELARGTNPAEGFAISKAMLNYLKKKSAITVITTHYDGLTEDDSIRHLQVRGLSQVDYDRLIKEISLGSTGIDQVHQYMDYRLIEADNRNTVPRDAINIARLMGLQEEILQEAQTYLNRQPS